MAAAPRVSFAAIWVTNLQTMRERGVKQANKCCLQVGTVSGEDYHFRFSGKIRDGKLFFRLKMEYEGDEEVTTAQFPHPPSRCRTMGT